MKIVYIVLLMWALAACAPQNAQRVSNQINSSLSAEESAWQRVSRENQTNCPSSTPENPLPKSRALEKHECWAELVYQHVGPVAASPELLAGLVLDVNEIALNYKEGDISRDRVNLAVNKRMETYFSELGQLARSSINNAAMQDRIELQDRRRYLLELQKIQSLQGPSSSQELGPASPNHQTTTCTGGLNTLNCRHR